MDANVLWHKLLHRDWEREKKREGEMYMHMILHYIYIEDFTVSEMPVIPPQAGTGI